MSKPMDAAARTAKLRGQIASLRVSLSAARATSSDLRSKLAVVRSELRYERKRMARLENLILATDAMFSWPRGKRLPDRVLRRWAPVWRWAVDGVRQRKAKEQSDG